MNLCKCIHTTNNFLILMKPCSRLLFVKCCVLLLQLVCQETYVPFLQVAHNISVRLVPSVVVHLLGILEWHICTMIQVWIIILSDGETNNVQFCTFVISFRGTQMIGNWMRWWCQEYICVIWYLYYDIWHYGKILTISFGYQKMFQFPLNRKKYTHCMEKKIDSYSKISIIAVSEISLLAISN